MASVSRGERAMTHPVRFALPLLLLAACGDSRTPPTPTPPAPPGVSAPAAAKPAAPPFDPVADAAASFRVTAAITPAELARGGVGQLALAIEITRPNVHVQKEFPLKVELTATAGLKAGKTDLRHADAVDPAGVERRWSVPVKAVAKGAQRVDALVRFAICRETEPEWCVVREEKVSASAVVR
jgi:hypothetical protein